MRVIDFSGVSSTNSVRLDMNGIHAKGVELRRVRKWTSLDASMWMVDLTKLDMDWIYAWGVQYLDC